MTRLLRAILLVAAAAAFTLAACSDDDTKSDAAVAADKGAATADTGGGGTSDQGVAGDQGSSADAPQPDAASGPVSCTLGSVYPGAGAIDPDNPDYAGGGKTKDEVRQMFAQAKKDNTNAYKAYKAAFKHAALVECAFCDCGCELTDKHKSAIDCFKDLHGFG